MVDVRHIANGRVDNEVEEGLNRLRDITGITEQQIEAIVGISPLNDAIARDEASEDISEGEARAELYAGSLRQLASDEFLESFQRAASRLALFKDDIFEVLEGAGLDTLLAIDALASRAGENQINHLVDAVGDDNTVGAIKGYGAEIVSAAKAFLDEIETDRGDVRLSERTTESLAKSSKAWVERVKNGESLKVNPSGKKER